MTKQNRKKRTPARSGARRNTAPARNPRRQGEDAFAPRTGTRYKDTVFRDLFKDASRVLELYNAVADAGVSGTVRTLPENAFLVRQNDLAFSIDDRLVVMVEHQSTWNPNMPLRFMLYFALVLELHILGSEKLYSTALVRIPTPEFYVLYNGDGALPQREIRLSDAYMHVGGEPMLEVTAKVIDINWSRKDPALGKSPSLEGYAYLIHEVRGNLKQGLGRDRAIGEAVKACMAKGKIEAYLKDRHKEVAAMLLTEYDYETDIRVKSQEAHEEGKAEGLKEGQAEIVRNMSARNMAPEQIAETIGLPLADVEAYIEAGKADKADKASEEGPDA